MPSVKDAVAANGEMMDSGKYVPAAVPRPSPPAVENKGNGLAAFMRCGLPPMSADPDSLSQFQNGAGVPQTRFFPIPPQSTLAIKNTAASTSSSTSSSSSSTATTPLLKEKTVVVTTGVIAPGDNLTTFVLMSRTFQMLSMSATNPCEVRVYGSSIAQSFDAARDPDAPVAPEITSNIICCVSFDTVPLVWPFQDSAGANQDTPRSSKIYITVINTGSAPSTGTAVTITYLPLEV